jgi:hypothetical protein
LVLISAVDLSEKEKGKSMKSLYTLLLFAMFASCKHTSGNKSNEDAQKATRSPGPVARCLGSTSDGRLVRCTEYVGSNELILNAARETCGKQDHGFVWGDVPCPTERRVGSCAYRDGSAQGVTWGDWMYSDAYTREQAQRLCADFDGTFSAN